MGLMERRNELITRVNYLMRKNMPENERRQTIFKLLREHENYVVQETLDNALKQMKEGV